MPELPEVETTLQAIKGVLLTTKINAVCVRETRLRWPVTKDLATLLKNARILGLSRRGKYILIQTSKGHLIIHLGMSGKLQILPTLSPIQKHAHIDIIFDKNKQVLRFTDPRRFGAFLWVQDAPLRHPLLAHLGPEPLTSAFSAKYLFNITKGRRAPIKLLIMNSQVVVGVGNIYANEALFYAQINPHCPAHKLNFCQIQSLTKMIKIILKKAIKRGGTTLRDFLSPNGIPGYFKQELGVYGREGQDCIVCQNILVQSRLGQRTTVWCEQCQKNLL